MGRRAAKPAAKAAKTQPKGWRSKSVLADTQRSKEAKRKRLEQAVQWCKDNGKGARAALRTGLFPGVTKNQLHGRLQSSNTQVIRDHHLQVLTNDERCKLATWLMKCADGNCPKNRDEITSKMREMLRARNKDNRNRKYGMGTIPLSRTEVQFANSSGPMWNTTYANLFRDQRYR